jgi:hypothetical protein
MAMADVDFNLIARQQAQIIDQIGFLRDENRVLTAICMRLESAQPAMVHELRALQSLIGRLDESFRKVEITRNIGTFDMSAEVSAISDLIVQKLLVVIDERFENIQAQLTGRHGDAGDAGGGGGMGGGGKGGLF